MQTVNSSQSRGTPGTGISFSLPDPARLHLGSQLKSFVHSHDVDLRRFVFIKM